MTLEIHPSTVEFILQEMESLTKSIVNSNVWEPEIIAKKIGQFQAFKQILDNSGYESYGLKFKIIFPTTEEYANKNSDE